MKNPVKTALRSKFGLVRDAVLGDLDREKGLFSGKYAGIVYPVADEGRFSGQCPTSFFNLPGLILIFVRGWLFILVHSHHRIRRFRCFHD